MNPFHALYTGTDKTERPRMSKIAARRPESDVSGIPNNPGDRATDATPDTDGILPDDSACSYIGNSRVTVPIEKHEN